MKKIFEITDTSSIEGLLDEIEFGTLALSGEKPYSVPVNFVYLNNAIYFHGSYSGKKMRMMKANPLASFSAVKSYSYIPSYFSTNDESACPATQFFKSIIIDGKIEIISDEKEKAFALHNLMKKLQPEGRYKDLKEEMYKKMIQATAVFKLDIQELKAKYKFGQHVT